MFLRTVNAWYRRQARAQGYGARVAAGDLRAALRNLNPHFHVLFLDGVYVPAADGGAPVLVAAPPLAEEDVQEIVETAAQRIVINRDAPAIDEDS